MNAIVAPAPAPVSSAAAPPKAKRESAKELCNRYLAQYFALVDATSSRAIKRAAGIPETTKLADLTDEQAALYAETRAAVQSEEWCAALNGWAAKLRAERVAGGVRLTDCHAPLVKRLIDAGEYTPTGRPVTVLEWIIARVVVKTTSAARVRASMTPRKRK
jgi:hypothetical protein